MVLEAIRYEPKTSERPASLQILDQLLLPHTTSWLELPDSRSAFDAIRSMRVRGAPAIALVAVLSLLAEDAERSGCGPESDASSAAAWYHKRLEYLVTSRPTAVNLADAAGKLNRIVTEAAKSEAATANTVISGYTKAAEEMLRSDVQDNKAIGEAGSRWIEAHTQTDGPHSVVTICNTGSLATAGYGTALGVVRSIHAAGSLRQVFYLETRPYNQGSRLTGYELLHDSIPCTLITDSMAAALFRTRGKQDNIAAVVVGADRVAANGDTANKIGTYGLAVLARQHGVRFLVAAPRTTIDLETRSGEDIVIEQRPQEEVLAVKGPTVKAYSHGQQSIEGGSSHVISTAAIGTQAWNPAFDVTPADLIDAIITEVGAIEKQDGRFELAKLFDN